MEYGVNDVAIIGIGCRFPGADSLHAYWKNLAGGVESISRLSDAQLLEHGSKLEDLMSPHYVKAKGVLNQASLFAATHFGYSPHEAKLMDPQHRILLETAYSALENAGIVVGQKTGPIGTFVSTGFNTYLLHCLVTRPELNDPQNHYQMAIGNGNDFLATRIAYKLNLTGPAQTVQTACSSSLVAIHNACQSLLNFECDVALAGGCAVTSPIVSGYMYRKDAIGSSDGHCRPFDKNANGTVPGNGAGVVVLKRVNDAIANDDHIYAVIKGSAINNDGNKKISYTAPSIQGQEEVIRSAHAVAGINSDTISYIEAHGTGTSLGDPIEIEALSRAFTSAEIQSNSCAVGSVKANIGHLDAAAGVAGFIKVILMLTHQKIPPQINFSELNPRVSFANSPFYINTVLSEWCETLHPRRAGVSAFGIGGTNAHIVLEEYANRNVEHQHLAQAYVLPISADTKENLAKYKNELVSYLEECSNVSLADASYTLRYRRTPLGERAYLIASRNGTLLNYWDNVMPQWLDQSQTEFVARWMGGDTDSQTPAPGRVVSLPSAPLQKEHYWISANLIAADVVAAGVVASDHNCSRVPTVPAITNVEQMITTIVTTCLEDETIQIQDNLRSRGVDSLLMIDISMMIEQQMGYEVSNADFYRYPTIQTLSCALQKRQSPQEAKRPLPEIAIEINRGEEGAPTLFCIHPAGGSVTVFDEIASYLSANYRVIGIQSAGWNGKPVMDCSIESMANLYAETLQAIQSDGPYYICGSSIGGTIAFEIARLLTHKNLTVGFVALLDSPAVLDKRATSKMPRTPTEIRKYIELLSPDMARDLTLFEARDPNTMTIFYHLWAIHASSLAQYKASACDLPVTYFYATEKNEFLATDLVSDWFELAKGGVEVHALEGNHLTIHQGNNARKIATMLERKMHGNLARNSLTPTGIAAVY